MMSVADDVITLIESERKSLTEVPLILNLKIDMPIDLALFKKIVHWPLFIGRYFHGFTMRIFMEMVVFQDV